VIRPIGWFLQVSVFFNRVPGLVVERPRVLYLPRNGFNSRSMVAGETFSSRATMGAGNSPYDWQYPGSQSGRAALSLLEQGRLAASQMVVSTSRKRRLS